MRNRILLWWKKAPYRWVVLQLCGRCRDRTALLRTPSAVLVLILVACLSLSTAANAAPTVSPDDVAPSVSVAGAALNVNAANAEARTAALERYASTACVRQLLFVSHTTGWEASVALYEKLVDSWVLTLETTAIIGKNGMGKSAEGDSRTPLGDYAVVGAFGIRPNPGTTLPYTNVQPTTYACDEDGPWYNQIIDTDQTGHDCQGEPMFYCTPEYSYGLIIDYNAEGVPGVGSAIFLHCQGQKAWTGGCIALTAADMLRLLQAAQPGMRVWLDEYYE